ncbi:MAG: hypothetical protein CMJ32_10790 [Phycisphaerae bacterium]|nr:hypothetical protein [Phycisphaerae bacterium]
MNDTGGKSGREVARRVLTPRKIVVQAIGFVIGSILLAWCIWTAITNGEWERLENAEWWMVAALIGCSFISAIINGTIFWRTAWPLKRMKWIDLQSINLTASLLNYAPIRLGLVFRYMYHYRMDGLGIIPITTWFVAVTLVLFACVSGAIMTTIIHPHLDITWALLLIAWVIVSAAILWTAARTEAARRIARGREQLLADTRTLVANYLLRMCDLAAWTARMTIAAMILDLPLTMAETFLISMAAIALSLNPLGRFGFREATVAIVAGHIVSERMDGDLEGTMAQLALVESAGEAVINIGLGLVAAIWVGYRWNTREQEDDQSDGR